MKRQWISGTDLGLTRETSTRHSNQPSMLDLETTRELQGNLFQEMGDLGRYVFSRMTGILKKQLGGTVPMSRQSRDSHHCRVAYQY